MRNYFKGIWMVALLMYNISEDTIVHSANFFVTPSGAGNQTGSSWDNAIPGLERIPWGGGANIGSGDTIWIAGGKYSSALYIGASGASGSPLCIYRARAGESACRESSGWQNSFDSQVLIDGPLQGIVVSSASNAGPGRYVNVDGRVPDGIRVNFSDRPGSRGLNVEGYGEFNSEFSNIGFYGPSTNVLPGESWNYVNDLRCIMIQPYDAVSEPFPSSVRIESCTLTGASTAMALSRCRDVLIERCNVHTIEALVGEPHANLAYLSRVTDLTFRFNDFNNNTAGVGMFFTTFGDGGIHSSNVFIYGNIFRDTFGIAQRCIEVRSGSEGIGPLYIYNNTFCNVSQAININAPLNPNAQSYIQNNLGVDIKSGRIVNFDTPNFVTLSGNYQTNSYNIFWNRGQTNVLPEPYNWQFVRDVHLKTSDRALRTGTPLQSPFDVDRDGISRAGGSTWTVGAYVLNAPNPPKNVRIVP